MGANRLEPEEASALGRSTTLRSLIQGYPKVGKTHSIVESAVKAFGFGYVINCGTRPGLEPALRATGPGKWAFNVAEYEEEVEDCVMNARRGCESGKYKWVLLDDFNLYVDRLTADHITEETQKDFNRWRHLCNKVCNTVRRFHECKAHVIIAVHLSDWQSTQLPGQNKKDAVGFVNVLPGRMRTDIPALCSEVLVMKKNADGERTFLVNASGVYGVGTRTTGPIDEIPADLGILQREVEKTSKMKAGGASSAPPAGEKTEKKPSTTPARKDTHPNGTPRATSSGSR